MRRIYSVGEASDYLHIDPKTLHRWCRDLGIKPILTTGNGHLKAYSQRQLDQIAVLLKPRSSKNYPLTLQEDIPSVEKVQMQHWQALQIRVEALERELRATRERIAQACLSNSSI